MEQIPLDEESVVRYLLGQAPEEERLRLEERAFSDQEIMQSVMAVERDLIDEYVRGELSAVERQQFEKLFLASPERRRKVEFARALTSLASESPVNLGVNRPVIEPAPISWREMMFAWLRGPRLALKFSLAAAILLVAVGVSLLIAETARLRGRLAQLEAQRQSQQRDAETRSQEEELRRQLAEQRRRNEELAGQLQQEREHLARLQKESITSRPIIASLTLFPGLPRSSANLPKLIIPGGAQQARLRIGLERGDDHKRFQVELRTAAGQAVWSQNDLPARLTRTGRSVILYLPASLLNAGEYELTLKGVTDTDEVEILGYYYFSIVKK